MKECFKCKEVKPLDDFYKHPQMPDGHVNKCKDCNKIDVRKNRADRIDYYRDYDRHRAMQPHRIAQRMEYQKTEQGKAASARAKENWRKNNPVKRKANVAVGNAVRDGRLIKSTTCQECGASGRIHGHHDDYAKPLEVRWLCPTCHNAWHKEHGEAANG